MKIKEKDYTEEIKILTEKDKERKNLENSLKLKELDVENLNKENEELKLSNNKNISQINEMKIKEKDYLTKIKILIENIKEIKNLENSMESDIKKLTEENKGLNLSLEIFMKENEGLNAIIQSKDDIINSLNMEKKETDSFIQLLNAENQKLTIERNDLINNMNQIQQLENNQNYEGKIQSKEGSLNEIQSLIQILQNEKLAKGKII